MSKIIRSLNKHRTKSKARVVEINEARANVRKGRTPNPSSRPPNVPTSGDVWEEFQFNRETGVKSTWRKRNLPDYRPGKVKVYTAEEIEEYERERST